MHTLRPPTDDKLSIAGLLVGIDMPDDIVGQPVDAVARALCHFGEPLRLGLVLKSVAGEIDAGAVDVGFDDDVDAADAVEGYLDVFVGEAVAHCGHVLAFRLVLFVAW
jgi:hypothetical protein